MISTKRIVSHLILCVLLASCTYVKKGSGPNTNEGSFRADESSAEPNDGTFILSSHDYLRSVDVGEARAQFQWKGRPRGQVAPGFEVELVNPTDVQLNGKFRVSFDGTLTLPYDIKVDTSGTSEAQLKQKILNAYRTFFQSVPTMQINVVDKRFWVDVRGLVNKPGQYLVRSDSSLDEVISAAGGLQSLPGKEPAAGGAATAARSVRIQQAGQFLAVDLADYYSGKDPVQPTWQGGEVLFFLSERPEVESQQLDARGGYVQVMGQVRSPGEYPYRDGADFFYYMVKAGGPTDRADLTRVRVIRGEDGRRSYQAYNIQDEQERASMLPIRPGDVVILEADNMTPEEKKIRLRSEIATIFTSIATVIILAVTL